MTTTCSNYYGQSGLIILAIGDQKPGDDMEAKEEK